MSNARTPLALTHNNYNNKNNKISTLVFIYIVVLCIAHNQNDIMSQDEKG